MRGRWVAAAGIVAVLAVGACSHSSGGGGSSAAMRGLADAGGAVAGGVPAPSKPNLAAPHAAGGLSGQSPRAGTAYGGKTANTANSLPLVDEGFKIRIARMTVAVKGAANVADKAN